MLYVDFDDTEIECLQTRSSIFGNDHIVACSRKEITEGIIINGLVVDHDKLTHELTEIFSSGYPKSIKDQTVAISVSDKQIISHRFFLDVNTEAEISKTVIEEAKKILPYDPIELDNFYKILGKDDQGRTEIFYTASSKHTIVHFARFLKSRGFKLDFFSSRSLSLYELLKPVIGESHKVVYADVNKKTIEYLAFDHNGPITSSFQKNSLTNFTTHIKSYLEHLEKEQNAKISKLIIGGSDSLEINTKELSENILIPIVKINDILDEILSGFNIKFETGGIPRFMFSHVLGLYLLSHTASPPNFAPDMKSLGDNDEIMPISGIGKKESAVNPPEELKTEDKDQTQVLDEIVEYKKSGIGRIFGNKIILIIISIVSGFFLLLGFFIIKGDKISVTTFFQPKPPPTPTPTIIPTLIPTPTIDVKLKRSDLKISVQNGTDKTGYAKEIASYLENKGYRNIVKSNADKDNYENTVIRIKDEKKNYLVIVTSDIKDKFDSSVVESLDNAYKYDIIIILGKK